MSSVARAFHKKLYALAALEASMELYAEFGALELHKRGDAWTVTFADVVDGLEVGVLADEFANHVLAGTVDRRR